MDADNPRYSHPHSQKVRTQICKINIHADTVTNSNMNFEKIADTDMFLKLEYGY